MNQTHSAFRREKNVSSYTVYRMLHSEVMQLKKPSLVLKMSQFDAEI